VLTDTQLLRYNRQLLLNEFDIAGQERLLAARVLIVGLGGLGCPAALYLAASGVGSLLLADDDCVEPSNLQRQIAHGEQDIGRNKAESAAEAIAALNPEASVQVFTSRLGDNNLDTLVREVDLVVDATDNYSTRFALNRACIARSLPLVSAAAVKAEGQLAVFDPTRGGPCYRCLYAPGDNDSALSCAQSGVLAPVVGTLGSLLAMESIKCIAGYGEPARGKLLLMDLRTLDIRTLTLTAVADCPDCGHLQKI